MDLRPLVPQRRARTSIEHNAKQRQDERYWKSWKSAVFIKSYAPIVALHFSQTSPYRYAVTSGTRIQVYSSKTNRVVKTISKFKEVARSGHIRDDGKLVLASDDSGLVQVFDIASRAVLRSIRAHRQPVHTVAFSPTSTSQGSPSILTASDDTTLKLYDLSTSAQLSYFAGHSDYVRTAAYVPTNPSLIVSGGYDGTVRLWDARIPGRSGAGATGDDGETLDMDVDGDTSTSQAAASSSKESGLAREVMSFKHGHPVEKILVHPSGTQVISAGGPVIRVWDILSDAGCLHAMSNHQKTVTCLEWGDGRPYSGNSKKNLLSAGLDGLIKSYDIEDNYRVSKTMRVGAGVLSLAMSPEESTMLIGSANGEIAIRKRILSATEQASKSALLEGGSAETALAAETFNKVKASQGGGVAESLELADQTITSSSNIIRNNNHEIVVKPFKQKSAKLKKWDKLLKTFQYGDALDSVIDDKSIHPGYAFAIFSELMHRDGLHQALNSRDEISLLPILNFLLKYIADYRYASVACDVTAVLIDIYTPALGQSATIDTVFQRLRNKVHMEVEFQRNLVEVKGQLQMIMAAQATA